MRYIDSIIVHCSDTPNNRDVTVEEIRGWHVKGNGWDDIGYHFIIYRNGDLMTGRPVRIAGAHCYGYNSNSIGICLIGRDKFTKAQFNALRNLDRVLQGVFGDLSRYGHRDLNKYKTCPNFDVKEVLTN